MAPSVSVLMGFDCIARYLKSGVPPPGDQIMCYHLNVTPPLPTLWTPASITGHLVIKASFLYPRGNPLYFL